ncbi:histone-lysine N-methyltransferase, H3 lysine-9 specific SUVH3-like [Vicia villosa]|uniref:histone-lysine N-methyltransferase, H3 lysine-9 specific SUVH3-like n=1 Tax=Vicia villosa TaxID=3911 RepID=UPI00273B0299|nr:histone-lysine N-methyltransferase, H3 lysine-9 specific SUVH3-like [Vicia villosa]
MEENNTLHASDSIDKSRIVEAKPLRSLAPVLPNHIQSCFPANYPSGFPPFCSFEKPQDIPLPKGAQEISVDTEIAEEIPVSGKETPVAAKVTPIRFYKSSVDEEVNPRANGDVNSFPEGLNGDEFVDDTRKRGGESIQNCKEFLKRKRNKKTREAGVDGQTSSSVGVNPSPNDEGNRESVNHVLMMYDSIRRRLCQLEDSKELNSSLAIKRADLRASNALTCKGIKTNLRRRAGAVPGIEVGDIFFFRMEMCLVGLHGQSMGGIDYMNFKDGSKEDTVALSVVSSGMYGDDTEDNDVLVYSGQGENFNKKDKHVTDQKLQRGNLALDRSAQRHDEVRVIRGLRDAVSRTAKIYMYDGLYKIQDSWIEKGKSGGGIFKYKLVRLPGQKSAFGAWKLAQKWKGGSASRNGFILADLSNGVESIPVSLVNDVDDEKGPAFFTYFTSLKKPKPFGLVQPSFGCNCKACIPGDFNCSCIQRNEGDFPYTANSILVSRKPLIHECGPMCRCLPNCKNRVSQTGLKPHMEVFRTKDRGWGLRTLDPIRAGSFICEYAGEVIDKAKVSQNDEEDNDEYIFDTSRIYQPFKWNHDPSLLEEVSSNVLSEDYTIPSPLIISAKNVGNVGRFMNHSCSPNVFWQPVLYAENNHSFLHIAFFALKHIPPMAELTYDYGFVLAGHAEGSSALRRKNKCLCGSEKCRGFFG